MAVVIVSHVIQSTRAELLLLRRRILMKKDKKTHFIDRAEFHDALRFVTIDQSDFEVSNSLRRVTCVPGESNSGVCLPEAPSE